MKHRWVRRARRGGLQVRPKSWNKLSAPKVQNGTLFKWIDRQKHSSIVLSSGWSQRFPSQTSTDHRDPHRQDAREQQAWTWPTGACNFPPDSKETNFILLCMRCNLLGEMFGFMCWIIESQIWGSLGISEEKVSNHKLIELGNRVTKEMFHCAWNIEPISPCSAFSTFAHKSVELKWENSAEACSAW